ncbi:MAG TPA: hypothetical protein VMF11_04150 [Candidatus Baltobacteraceae bacterium]|nr:hypothetical protein [Candidatus Baltobacteraceae bacterium]
MHPKDDQLIAEFLLSFRDFAENTFFAITATLMDARDRIDPVNTLLAERTAKSTQSITEKLLRQPSLRLDQIQDIVGCRIIAINPSQQEEILSVLQGRFPSSDVKDRRANPTFGYRAVHLIVRDGRLRYEVQVRTRTQHIWATIVERLISKYGIQIKYGGGPPDVQERLQQLAGLISLYETEADPEALLTARISSSIDELESALGDGE